MPGYTLPLTESRIIADLMKRQRGMSTGIVDSGGLSIEAHYDRWPLTGTPGATYTLTYLPLNLAVWVFLNGLELDEGTDYTLDYTTGVITTAVTLLAGDILAARYLTTGALAAQTAPVPLQSVGWESGAGFSVGATITAGVRNSGTWAYSTVASGQPFHDLGVGDGYSVEATLSAIPSAGFASWWAAVNNAAHGYADGKGTYFEINPENPAAYIVLARDSVVTQVSAPTLPTVGQAVKLVTDFTAKTSTVFYGGVQQAQLDLSPYPWYTPDGALA